MSVAAKAEKSNGEQRLHVVEKRGEYHFAVLAPNPDAGKQGVCYSGDYFTLCTTDGPEEAKRIARAMNLLIAAESLSAVKVVE